jgi:molybdate transport system substrate-binding protein
MDQKVSAFADRNTVVSGLGMCPCAECHRDDFWGILASVQSPHPAVRKIQRRPSRNHLRPFENADVVVMVRSALDDLVKKGQVIEGSQVDLARSRIGMAVRAGATVPDISSVDAFRYALLEAKSVAYSDSASGVYVATTLFKRLGIEKEMAAKSKQIPAEPVGLAVARGEAEIGFQQMSELKPIAGITLVGPIPDDVQLVTIFSAGLVLRATNKDGGEALIKYLSSPEACHAIEESAIEPVACAKK